MDPLGERLQAAVGPDYKVGRELGRGGMGVVYRATDLRLARDVAMKVLPPELGYREDLRKRFVREARFAASLAHPNIIPIHDVGEDGSLVWFVMQFVEGETLLIRVARTGPQSIDFTARVMQDVAFGLAYAHARGVVHRDIKPDNIMIERATGRAIVMDFGIAKAVEETGSALTGPGAFVGSVGYMSPEQAAGEERLDGRSDLFSLGLVGHYLLTGRAVYEGPNAQAILAKVLTQTVPSIRVGRRDVPDWLEAAVDGCTAAARADRFERAEDLLEQLSVGSKPIEIHPAARQIVRWASGYGVASAVLAWTWVIVGGPLVDVNLVGALGVGAAFLFGNTVMAATWQGVGWNEIRLALLDARRQWVEERQWRMGLGHRPLGFWMAVGLAVVFFPLFAFRSTPAGKPPWHEVLGPIMEFYAVVSGILFVRIFGLPGRGRKPAEWRFPRWLDWIGRALFTRIGRAPALDAPGRWAMPTVEKPAVLAAPSPSLSGTGKLIDAAIRLSSRIRELVRGKPER